VRQWYSTQLALIAGIFIALIVLVFAIVQSPHLLDIPETSPVAKAGPMPHAVEGYERCDACHGIDGIMPYPLTHLGWNNRSCIKCHLQYNRL
jgi:hypothetical protein